MQRTTVSVALYMQVTWMRATYPINIQIYHTENCLQVHFYISFFTIDSFLNPANLPTKSVLPFVATMPPTVKKKLEKFVHQAARLASTSKNNQRLFYATLLYEAVSDLRLTTTIYIYVLPNDGLSLFKLKYR